MKRNNISEYAKKLIAATEAAIIKTKEKTKLVQIELEAKEKSLIVSSPK